MNSDDRSTDRRPSRNDRPTDHRPPNPHAAARRLLRRLTDRRMSGFLAALDHCSASPAMYALRAVCCDDRPTDRRLDNSPPGSFGRLLQKEIHIIFVFSSYVML